MNNNHFYVESNCCSFVPLLSYILVCTFKFKFDINFWNAFVFILLHVFHFFCFSISFLLSVTQSLVNKIRICNVTLSQTINTCVRQHLSHKRTSRNAGTKRWTIHFQQVSVLFKNPLFGIFEHHILPAQLFTTWHPHFIQTNSFTECSYRFRYAIEIVWTWPKMDLI